jgi:hypothetical protein
MGALSEADLNELYDAALEFGANWRRPMRELAAERLVDRPQDYRDGIAAAVDECRTLIEGHIDSIHQQLQGQWTRAARDEVDAWLTQQFPWMTNRNRRHAINQGQYYAWHG